MTTTTATTATTGAAANPLISSGSTSKASSASATATLNYNFQEFLTLFTTQLKNQDPTKPMDTTEMTNQLALFSNVEQTAGINSRLDKLLAAQQSSTFTTAAGYIGKTVEASGNQVALTDGSATIAYDMPASAPGVTIEIHDSHGLLVRTLAGAGGMGAQELSWDGKDQNGTAMPNGAYTVAVAANGESSDTLITPTVRATGKVTGVETSGTDTVLNLGPIQVKLSDVVALRG